MKVTRLPPTPVPQVGTAYYQSRNHTPLNSKITADWLIIGAGFAAWQPPTPDQTNYSSKIVVLMPYEWAMTMLTGVHD